MMMCAYKLADERWALKDRLVRDLQEVERSRRSSRVAAVGGACNKSV